MKNKKVLIFIIALVVLTVIGTTLAYYTNTFNFRNLFKTGVYQNEVTEVFNSPDDWTPGTETPKTLVVKNTGQVCENVRVSYTEEWKSANGNELPLKQNNESVAIINFDNPNDWKKRGNYYYYNKDLLEGQSTSSFIKSVAYNPNTVGDYTCTNENGTQRCTSSGNGYDGADYTLTLKVETVQCDAMENVWNTTLSEINDSGVTLAPIYGGAEGSDPGGMEEDDITNDYYHDMIWYNGLANSLNIYVKQIESIETVNNKTVPSNALKSIPYGVDKEGNISDEIMIWYLDEDNNNLYEVYIGQDGGVVANENSSHLFDGLPFLKKVDLSNFDTSSVTDMSGMFSNCKNLTSLDLSSFDTSNVTNMSSMFYYCRNLTTLDLSSFDTSNVTDMTGMFSECSSLTTLDLSSFNTSNVTDMTGMFSECSSLTTIYVSNYFIIYNGYSTGGLFTKTYDMFLGCYSLIGGNGTTYNRYNPDMVYARIDKPGESGYFSTKN